MVKSAVTIAIVPEARKGPFVFHEDVAAGCAKAAALGFDAVELFAPSAEAINAQPVEQLLSDHNLSLAAVGTGAGMVIHGLHPKGIPRREASRLLRTSGGTTANYLTINRVSSRKT